MFVNLRPLGIEGKRGLVGHGWKASLEGVETGQYGRKQEELLSLKWEKGKATASNALTQPKSKLSNGLSGFTPLSDNTVLPEGRGWEQGLPRT